MKDLDDCIESLLNQNFNDFEILVVVDHNERLYESLKRKFVDPKIKIILNNSQHKGQASTMNRGVEKARGDIVCFLDDDAVASESWLSKIVHAYDEDTWAVGGRIEPMWIGIEPSYLPKEFYWMVGATGGYLPSDGDIKEVRNLWSGNISYRKSLFNKVGFFREDLGEAGDPLFQGEDAEFGLRILKLTGKGIKYAPDAVVYHKIRSERIKFRQLLKRAFEQGYAKAYIRKVHRDIDALTVERNYLKFLFKSSLGRLKCIILGPDRLTALKQLLFIVTATLIVLLGFVYALIRVGI
jgi:glycosyltransferase involved in cell wall biosynthesis